MDFPTTKQQAFLLKDHIVPTYFYYMVTAIILLHGGSGDHNIITVYHLLYHSKIISQSKEIGIQSQNEILLNEVG